MTVLELELVLCYGGECVSIAAQQNHSAPLHNSSSQLMNNPLPVICPPPQTERRRWLPRSPPTLASAWRRWVSAAAHACAVQQPLQGDKGCACSRGDGASHTAVCSGAESSLGQPTACHPRRPVCA